MRECDCATRDQAWLGSHSETCELLTAAIVIIENLLEGAPNRLRDARLFLEKIKNA